MKKGLFIGRFQPFHNGHLAAVRQALKEVDELIIGIGSSQFSNEKENPFSYEERKKMISSVLKKYPYKVYPIPDTDDDERWIRNIQQILPKFDIVYSGNPITISLFNKNKISVHNIKLMKGISSSKIRELIKKRKPWKHLTPREIVIFLKKNYGIERIKRLN